MTNRQQNYLVVKPRWVRIFCAGGCGRHVELRSKKVVPHDFYLCNSKASGAQCEANLPSRLPGQIQVREFSAAASFSGISYRWPMLGDGSGVVQRDVYSAFLARCVMGNTHHPSHIETMWAAQKPVLLQTGWLRKEPARIEPSGKITVATPLEQVVCDRGFAIGHSRDAVVARREPGDPAGFTLRTHAFRHGEV